MLAGGGDPIVHFPRTYLVRGGYQGWWCVETQRQGWADVGVDTRRSVHVPTRARRHIIFSERGKVNYGRHKSTWLSENSINRRRRDGNAQLPADDPERRQFDLRSA